MLMSLLRPISINARLVGITFAMVLQNIKCLRNRLWSLDLSVWMVVRELCSWDPMIIKETDHAMDKIVLGKYYNKKQSSKKLFSRLSLSHNAALEVFEPVQLRHEVVLVEGHLLVLPFHNLETTLLLLP